MIEWISVDDAMHPPPEFELMPIARSDWSTMSFGYVQFKDRVRRLPRQIWFNKENKPIRKPDFYGVRA